MGAFGSSVESLGEGGVANHPLVEAILGRDGQPDILLMTRLVDGWRRGQIQVGYDNDLVLKETEAQLASFDGNSQSPSWGIFAEMLAETIRADSIT